MTPAELLADSSTRVREGAIAVVDGLSADDLRHRPAPEANPIGWLVWHLARVQDDHVAEAAAAISRGEDSREEGSEVYDDFARRFDLPYDDASIGYGHSSAEVGEFSAPADLLSDYVAAVHDRTLAFLATLQPADLDLVVDDRFDPPVTLGVRLVSVVDDGAQHVGQAAYVRGMLGR